MHPSPPPKKLNHQEVSHLHFSQVRNKQGNIVSFFVRDLSEILCLKQIAHLWLLCGINFTSKRNEMPIFNTQ